MKRPFYTSTSNQDLAHISQFIARGNPQAALAWIDRIEAKCLLIASNPSLGDLQPHLGEGVRASVVGRYVIFHREKNSRVEILRIIAGDRDIRVL